MFLLKIWYFLWRNYFTLVFCKLLFLKRKISIDSSPIFVGMPIFKGRGNIVIGKKCTLASSKCSNPIGLFRPCIFEAINKDSTIEIGDNFSASGVCIVSEAKVLIGHNVMIGANVTIIDTDFHPIKSIDGKRSNYASNKEIIIEDDVWIGMNAVILKGVTIYRGAVIGANAVITKDIPAGAKAVGNPARILL
ncbi:DapH/DapD/GlmU-related protein [Aeromonas rivipollensis]|uniref:DapH/DapD/GlmU-related protein n=1 Tax=Aeromonas rivipollensis TaxID=948519 RepID=UPI0038EC0BEB